MEKNKMKSFALTLAVLFATLGVAIAATETTQPVEEETATLSVSEEVPADSAEKTGEAQ
jgi:hypothetical protein